MLRRRCIASCRNWKLFILLWRSKLIPIFFIVNCSGPILVKLMAALIKSIINIPVSVSISFISMLFFGIMVRWIRSSLSIIQQHILRKAIILSITPCIKRWCHWFILTTIILIRKASVLRRAKAFVRSWWKCLLYNSSTILRVSLKKLSIASILTMMMMMMMMLNTTTSNMTGVRFRRSFYKF